MALLTDMAFSQESQAQRYTPCLSWRVQAKGGLSARFEAAAVLPFLFPVRGENGAAAIKNAGAFAPVAHSDFVIACNQAFGIILFPNFRVVSF